METIAFLNSLPPPLGSSSWSQLLELALWVSSQNYFLSIYKSVCVSVFSTQRLHIMSSTPYPAFLVGFGTPIFLKIYLEYGSTKIIASVL